MLDPRVTEDTATQPDETAAVEGSRRLFEVWLRWDQDGGDLRAQIKPEAALEQFTLLSAEPVETKGPMWKCVFEHRGRVINFSHQTVSLLRRLAPIAVWVKAERVEDGAPGRSVGSWPQRGGQSLQ